MAGIDDNVGLTSGDWGLPSPRILFSGLPEEDNNVTNRTEGLFFGTHDEIQKGNMKDRAQNGLVERMAARAGFNAPRLNTESIRSTDLSLNSDFQSPYLTIPPGLSPATLLDSPVFLANSLINPTILPQESLAGIEAPIQSENSFQPQNADAVTVQTENRSGPHHQEDFTKSPNLGVNIEHSCTAPEEQAGEEGDERGNRDSLAAGVGGTPTPSEDGYNWRKYGQKQVKGCEYPRSYYKCTHPNCLVKKKVERSHEGHITEIIYKGAHNHQKPFPNRRSGIGSSANPHHTDMQVDNPEHVEPQCGANGDHHLGWVNGQNWKHDNLEGTSSSPSIPEYGNSSTNLQTQNGTNFDSEDVVDGSSTFSNEEVEDDQGTHGKGDESESKRRKLEAYATEMSGATRAIREPRVVVQTTSEVDILDDGYRWRKYGQKVVKGNPNPRSYYKCTNAGCTVRKHVERASHDLKSVITTYEGKHNHEVPAARASSHVNANLCQGQVSGLLQSHAHRPEPSQVNKSIGRPSLGSFNILGRQQLGHSHGFSFRMNQPINLSNLPMSGFGPSPAQPKLPAMPMNPFFALQQQQQQQQHPSNGMGFMLPKGEPNVGPPSNPECGLNMPSGSSAYQEIMNHMPFGPHHM